MVLCRCCHWLLALRTLKVTNQLVKCFQESFGASPRSLFSEDDSSIDVAGVIALSLALQNATESSATHTLIGKPF